MHKIHYIIINIFIYLFIRYQQYQEAGVEEELEDDLIDEDDYLDEEAPLED